MDGMIDKLKRKLAISEEPEVISPADAEQRLRQMLGYAQPKKNIDPGFAAKVPAYNGDNDFAIKEPDDYEPQRPIPGKPGQVDMVLRHKKKKRPIDDLLIEEPLYKDQKTRMDKALDDAAAVQRIRELSIDPLKMGSSGGGGSLKSKTKKAQQEIQQEMEDEFYRQAELRRKQREAAKGK